MAERGLRILAVHVDAGWNSEIAVHNIEQIVERCEIDLFTHVVNWEEMRSLQLAYLRSGIANQDVPQDHVFFSTLYQHAIKHKIRYVLNGGNIATEGIFPPAWHGSAMDARNLKAIHRRFGGGERWRLPHGELPAVLREYPYLRRMKVVRPLNYMPYDKPAALEELQERVGYKEYGRKHGESLFTGSSRTTTCRHASGTTSAARTCRA